MLSTTLYGLATLYTLYGLATLPVQMNIAMMNPICQRDLCDGVLKSRSWDNVTLISIDIVSFTETSAQMDSVDVCKMLTSFYAKVDKFCLRHNVDKIDIVGDAYIAVAQFADDAVAFCLATLALAKTTSWKNDEPKLGVLHLRCAVHTGKVTGLVLDSVPFKYTLVGDTVTTTKKLETLTPPGHVNCSAATARCLDSKRFHLVHHEGHSECYLVYNAVDAERTVMHIKNLKFATVSSEFVRSFGFDRKELRSMRPVLGPKTRLDAIHMAMELCFEFNHPVSIPVFLYSRTAEQICTVLEFTKADDQYEDCVMLQCVALSR